METKQNDRVSYSYTSGDGTQTFVINQPVAVCKFLVDLGENTPKAKRAPARLQARKTALMLHEGCGGRPSPLVSFAARTGVATVVVLNAPIAKARNPFALTEDLKFVAERAVAKYDTELAFWKDKEQKRLDEVDRLAKEAVAETVRKTLKADGLFKVCQEKAAKADELASSPLRLFLHTWSAVKRGTRGDKLRRVSLVTRVSDRTLAGLQLCEEYGTPKQWGIHSCHEVTDTTEEVAKEYFRKGGAPVVMLASATA